MKKYLILLALCLPIMAMAQKKVAVYVTSEAQGIDNDTKEIIGGEIVAAIVNTNKYKAVERTSDFLNQISREQGYQHSGSVDDDQISAIGKQFGVDYVCVATIRSYRNEYYIQARLIDVETATVENSARETSTLANIDEIINAASKVAHTLINPEAEYVAPTAQTSGKKGSSRRSDAYVPSGNVEGQVVRYNYTERKALGYSEYALGETQMDRKAMAQFFAQNCPAARIEFFKGQQKITAGWCLLGIGAALTVTGWTLWGCADDIAEKNAKGSRYYYYYRRWLNACMTSGIVVGSIGAASVISSVVILPLGYKQRDNAYKIYNDKCAYRRTAAVTLNLQSGSDGLGIALRF